MEMIVFKLLQVATEIALAGPSDGGRGSLG